jgi:uncharacterized protein (DUF433 family)
MNLAIPTEKTPLHQDTHGVIRVGQTRVTLDVVVGAFLDGATAEEIVQQYPVLDLADVYSVLGYYLRHAAEVTQYLNERTQQITSIQQQNEALFNPQGIRQRLLTRQNKRGDDASLIS